MKNCGSGRPLLQLWLLWTLFWVPKSFATVDRELWYFEQLGSMPEALGTVQARDQLGLNILNYRDAISFETSGLIDASLVEVLLRGSQRTFLSLDNDGSNLQALLAGETQTAFLEVARFYRTRQSMYGRLSVGIAQFFPNDSRWVKLGLDTGVLSTPELPWSFSIHTAFFPSLSQMSDFLSVSVEVAHQISEGASGLQFGLGTDWGYRMGTLPSNLNESDFEHMMFTFGPLLKWNSSWGTFRARLLLRVLLDQTFETLDDGTISTVYPSELGIPDITIGWSLPL